MDANMMKALQDLRFSPAHVTGTDGHDEGQNLTLDPSILSDWIQYSSLVSWVASELKALCPEVDEAVSPITLPAAADAEGQGQGQVECLGQEEGQSPTITTTPEGQWKSQGQGPNLDDISSFKMELSGLLKELGCPYTSLIEEPLASRFEALADRQILLNYLLSELEAARMIHARNKQGTSAGCTAAATGSSMNVTLKESPTAKILREICQELGVGVPSEGSSVEDLWGEILAKVKGRIGVGGLEPLLTGGLTQDQWTLLDNHFKELKSDYGMRREMLLQRLDVTVESFKWSDKVKGENEVKLRDEYDQRRTLMNPVPGVEMVDVLAARDDLPIVERTSSAGVRRNTRSAVNDVLIGPVPDRGGRPNEVEHPPIEMPNWQVRQPGPSQPGFSGWRGQRGGSTRGLGGFGGGRGQDQGRGRGQCQGGGRGQDEGGAQGVRGQGQSLGGSGRVQVQRGGGRGQDPGGSQGGQVGGNHGGQVHNRGGGGSRGAPRGRGVDHRPIIVFRDGGGLHRGGGDYGGGGNYPDVLEWRGGGGFRGGFPHGRGRGQGQGG